ncbi:calmodulin regulator protein PCP4a isoform X2 [Simochromis diagramma]|uniref:calmodulin regulator protein PCP4a isoform X2 n=1 Tax=Simochromis diagramma TaxID=43689 RepID=UPI001A7ED9AA|nr:calmodulin regulator protein PCP4a isoform X2 [Simochromis diagramma]
MKPKVHVKETLRKAEVVNVKRASAHTVSLDAVLLQANGIIPSENCQELQEQRQASGPMTGNSKASVQGLQGQQKVPSKQKKNNLPPDFDIDMDAPETAKAAVTIQSQFRKFQKKKQDVKS